MKVKVNVVGVAMDQPRPEVERPEGWPIPRVGDNVDFDDLGLYVRHVVWYPKGDPEYPSEEGPFVYIVIGTTKVGG